MTSDLQGHHASSAGNLFFFLLTFSLSLVMLSKLFKLFGKFLMMINVLVFTCECLLNVLSHVSVVVMFCHM